MNGFLVKVVDIKIIYVQKISLVEYLKLILIKSFNANNEKDMIKIANLAIDIFVIAKWTFIFCLLMFNIHSKLINVSVVYLLVMNISTYFYYHFWCERAIRSVARSVNHFRRRFISLILAIGYNIISFAYIYVIGYKQYFTYNPLFNRKVCSIIHSLASTFTGGSSFITPNHNIGLLIQTSQILISFLFVGILLSKTDSIKEEC